MVSDRSRPGTDIDQSTHVNGETSVTSIEPQISDPSKLPGAAPYYGEWRVLSEVLDAYTPSYTKGGKWGKIR